jgi:hypothetical protein
MFGMKLLNDAVILSVSLFLCFCCYLLPIVDYTTPEARYEAFVDASVFGGLGVGLLLWQIRKMKTYYKPVALILLVITGFGATLALIEVVKGIPAEDRTFSTIKKVAWAITKAEGLKKELPRDLEELKAKNGFEGDINDGWGRPIEYKITGERSFILRSFGKDGKGGGNDDITFQYTIEQGGRLNSKYMMRPSSDVNSNDAR